MSLLPYENLYCAPPIGLTELAWENSSTYGNRLYKHSDGTIALIPKSLFEVLGEQVLRPVLNGAHTTLHRSLSILGQGLSSIDSAFGRLINFLPVARAYTPRGRTIVLPNFQEEVEEENFKTIDDAKEYLEDLGLEVTSSDNCSARSLIEMIGRTKSVDPEKAQELLKTYRDLIAWARAGDLPLCSLPLEELFSNVSADVDSYSIVSLRSLSEVCLSLINGDLDLYTLSDLSVISNKINELSHKLVIKIGKTNDVKTFNAWLETLFVSADNGSQPLEKLFETIIEILETKTGNPVSGEQIRGIRKLSRKVAEGSFVKQADLAKKILQMTGSQIMFLRVVESYLEILPEEIEKFDGYLYEILGALMKTSVMKPTLAVGIATMSVLTILSLGFTLCLCWRKCFKTQPSAPPQVIVEEREGNAVVNDPQVKVEERDENAAVPAPGS